LTLDPRVQYHMPRSSRRSRKDIPLTERHRWSQLTRSSTSARIIWWPKSYQTGVKSWKSPFDITILEGRLSSFIRTTGYLTSTNYLIRLRSILWLFYRAPHVQILTHSPLYFFSHRKKIPNLLLPSADAVQRIPTILARPS
jgi:hypothetical protein